MLAICLLRPQTPTRRRLHHHHHTPASQAFAALHLKEQQALRVLEETEREVEAELLDLGLVERAEVDGSPQALAYADRSNIGRSSCTGCVFLDGGHVLHSCERHVQPERQVCIDIAVGELLEQRDDLLGPDVCKPFRQCYEVLVSEPTRACPACFDKLRRVGLRSTDNLWNCAYPSNVSGSASFRAGC